MRLISSLRWLVIGLLMLSFTALAADEPIAVIVSPSHTKLLKKEDLSLIFKRKKLFWSDGSKIQPVNLPTSNPYRNSFSQAVLAASPEDLEEYWNDMYFHGISPPYVVLSEEAVMRFVIETPGAIGYVPFCSVNNRVAIALVITSNGRISEDTNSVSCSR